MPVSVFKNEIKINYISLRGSKWTIAATVIDRQSIVKHGTKVYLNWSDNKSILPVYIVTKKNKKGDLIESPLHFDSAILDAYKNMVFFVTAKTADYYTKGKWQFNPETQIKEVIDEVQSVTMWIYEYSCSHSTEQAKNHQACKQDRQIVRFLFAREEQFVFA